ncbi:MAG TPA: hypothetical protein PKA88_03005, partial [Polyangiaceae bacterium]|nr:hypothetical protein [Polyangiaceae bacterium]
RAGGTIVLVVQRMAALAAALVFAWPRSGVAAPPGAASMGPEVPAASRPRPWLVRASLLGIVCQGIFALYYLGVRYGG